MQQDAMDVDIMPPQPNGAAAAAGDGAAANNDVLFVPLVHTDDDGTVCTTSQAVALPLRGLPGEPTTLLDILSMEASRISVWLDAAKAYLARGDVKAFLDILRDAMSDDVLDGIKRIYHHEPRAERLALNTALAGYYIEAGRAEADAANRASKYAEAERHIREAAAVMPSEMEPVMARGLLALAKGDTTAALVEFRRASTMRRAGLKNHAPLLAQAAILFNQGNIAGALGLYAQVLRENPECPPEVRLGIGACYYRAGKLEAAAAAYNRVLDLDPGCADALLGLAMVKFGSSDVQEGLNGGLQLLQRAFAADPTHPGVLMMLGHFSLLKGSYDQAFELARAAHDAADTSKLRVAALTLMGRCEHARNRMEHAQQHYAQAIHLDQNQPLAHLGYAQVFLAGGGDPTNVVSELELVLQQLQGNSDALMLLGGLLPVRPERVAKTLAAHKEAAARQTQDAALQEILGELLAASDPAGALAAFDQAVALRRAVRQAVAQRNAARAARRAALQEQHQQQQDGGAQLQRLLAEVGEDEPLPRVPRKLLSNAAVLKYRSGDTAAALALMEDATAGMDQDADVPPMHLITMGYNMARLQEATGNLKAASDAYTVLLSQFPNYIDCYLRLAALARAAGQTDAAHEWAGRAATQAGGDVDAQATLATLHLQAGSTQEARECVRRAHAASPASRGDPYLLLTHANVIMAALSTQAPSRLAADPARRRQQTDHVSRALDFYRQVLRKQPDNIYAVNGIGTCLAELGHLSAAKAAFDEVLRGAARSKGFITLPEAVTNLGHVALARRQYADALRLYGHAAGLGGPAGREHELKALSLMARTHLDARTHADGVRCLLRAAHLAPWDHKLRFNLAFMLQEAGMQAFKVRCEYAEADLPRKVADREASQAALKQAARMFAYFLAGGKALWAAMDVRQEALQAHSAFLESKVVEAAHLVRDAKTELGQAKKAQAVRQTQLLQAEAERVQQELARTVQQREAEQARLQPAAKALEESRAKVREIKQRLAKGDDGANADGDGADGGGGKGGKKRARGGGGKGGAGKGGGADEFYVDDDEPIERLPKKKDAKAELKRGGLDTDSDDADFDAEAADPDVEAELFGSDGGGSDDGEQQQAAEGGDADEGPADQEQQQQQRSRLKRRGGDGAEGEQAAAADDEGLFGDDDGGAGGDDDEAALFGEEVEDGGEQEQQPARKRGRQQTLDSDEDDDEGGQQQQPDGAAAAPAASGGDSDLFGE